MIEQKFERAASGAGWASALGLADCLAFAGLGTVGIGEARAATPYPAMAPVADYLMADRNAEIALARSAAPASVSADAEVLVLGPKGYVSAAPGKNGFVCLASRSWFSGFNDDGFWNPKENGPICFNRQAARSVLPTFLTRTTWAMAGVSRLEPAGVGPARPCSTPGKSPRPGGRFPHLHDVQGRLSRRRPARPVAPAPDVLHPAHPDRTDWRCGPCPARRCSPLRGPSVSLPTIFYVPGGCHWSGRHRTSPASAGCEVRHVRRARTPETSRRRPRRPLTLTAPE